MTANESGTVAPLVYSVDQAAAQLGIGRNALYQEIARGRLRSFKHGHRRRIARVDLVAFVELLRKESEVGASARRIGVRP